MSDAEIGGLVPLVFLAVVSIVGLLEHFHVISSPKVQRFVHNDAVGFTIFFLIFVSVSGLGRLIVEAIQRRLGSYEVQLAVVVGMFAMGAFAFYFKKKQRRLYGVVECAFALASLSNLAFFA